MFRIPLEVRLKGVTVQQAALQMRGGVAEGMKRAAVVLLGALRRASVNDPMHARTGNLGQHWGVEPLTDAGEGFAGSMETVVRNDMVYARIHETGGTITPTRAKALAIPISGGPAVTARGVPRFTGPIRDAFPEAFVLKLATRKAYLARKAGRGGNRIELLFSLIGSVEMPARLYASKAVESVKDRVTETIRKAAASGPTS